jgi:hypothetical protein
MPGRAPLARDCPASAPDSEQATAIIGPADTIDVVTGQTGDAGLRNASPCT